MFIVVSHYLYKVIHAERRGFEPRIPFRGIHAFQACLFNHSSISPKFQISPLFLAFSTNILAFGSVFSYKCILFFVLLQHSCSFILQKNPKLINFNVFGSLFEHSKHF